MANQKPKKSGKKPSAKPETKKSVAEVKEAKVVKETKASVATVAPAVDSPMKGFFARKCDKNENILTIFKTPKIWGALMGELIGTMLVTMFLVGLGMTPLYIMLCFVAVYAAVVGLSGAHLNPIVTVGAMATRRVSAIRGILYMLAQLLGGWIGLIIMNAFRLGADGATTAELQSMTALTAETGTFWPIALLEFLGAAIIAFCYARVIRYGRKSPAAFAIAMASVLTLVSVLGLIIAGNFYGLSNTFIFNPVVALMYQILPSAADSIGELAQLAGLALAAYVLVPMIGGVIGFFISDIATRLSCGGYFCDCDDEEGCCTK